jgi:hypothetical protein
MDGTKACRIVTDATNARTAAAPMLTSTIALGVVRTPAWSISRDGQVPASRRSSTGSGPLG